MVTPPAAAAARAAAAAATAATPGMAVGYNKNSAAQGNVVATCLPLLARAAQAVPLPRDNTLAISEWGCSAGGNSIAPVLTICQALQARLSELPANNRAHERPLQLQVSHVDVATNDWTELFKSCQSYAAQARASCPELHVSYAGVGSSMYCRNHPSASLDIGFAMSTLHWQSRKAVVLSQTIYPVGPKVLPEEQASLHAHAVADLKSFLLLRAEEFRPGGMLVLGHISCHEETEHDAGAATSWRVQYHQHMQAVADEMVAEGLLRQEELGRMAPPVFFLDSSTQRQVFDELSDLWELQHHVLHTGSSPITAAWRAGEATDEQLATAFTAFFRAVTEPCYVSGLAVSGRSPDEVARLVDELFVRLRALALREPRAIEFPFAAIVLRRK